MALEKHKYFETREGLTSDPFDPFTGEGKANTGDNENCENWPKSFVLNYL